MYTIGYIRPYLEYVVWYRQSDASEWRTMRILSRTAMEATITNLEPNHEYEFMVLSQDRFGEGMFSRAFKYFTKRMNHKHQRCIFSNMLFNFLQHVIFSAR